MTAPTKDTAPALPDEGTKYVCTNQKIKDYDGKVRPCGSVLVTRRAKPAACPRCGSAMKAAPVVANVAPAPEAGDAE